MTETVRGHIIGGDYARYLILCHGTRTVYTPLGAVHSIDNALLLDVDTTLYKDDIATYGLHDAAQMAVENEYNREYVNARGWKIIDRYTVVATTHTV